MIKFEKCDVWGFAHAIRGMRNSMNSWDKSDSRYEYCNGYNESCRDCECGDVDCHNGRYYLIGENDRMLMKQLVKAGSSHRKFLRQIFVSVDITAPLYWWKEYETYKVGTVSNSCSTMHKISAKEFTLDDFSHEHLTTRSMELLLQTIKYLNECRDLYVNHETHYNNGFAKPTKKEVWWQMIQLLPSSYNQKRTVTMSYENLLNICNQRRNHKLDEWHDFCDWIFTLPYSEILKAGVIDT